MDLATITAERTRLGIQLEESELLAIVNSVHPPINLLVFGLGNDSVFWQACNRGGRTVFLEDNSEWFQKIRNGAPDIEAYLLSYGTKRFEWWRLLRHSRKLLLDLPQEISGIAWDVVLVDGPNGHTETSPGRMCSIYTAAQIIKPGGDVFLHDCSRKVEKIYSDIFLRKENLISETLGRDTLRHYRMTLPPRTSVNFMLRYVTLLVSFLKKLKNFLSRKVSLYK